MPVQEYSSEKRREILSNIFYVPEEAQGDDDWWRIVAHKATEFASEDGVIPIELLPEDLQTKDIWDLVEIEIETRGNIPALEYFKLMRNPQGVN